MLLRLLLLVFGVVCLRLALRAWNMGIGDVAWRWKFFWQPTYRRAIYVIGCIFNSLFVVGGAEFILSGAGVIVGILKFVRLNSTRYTVRQALWFIARSLSFVGVVFCNSCV